MDIGLLVLLGLISLGLKNDLFFKLKPGFVGLIFTAILGYSAFTPRNILLNMAQRYMNHQKFNDYQLDYFKRTVKVLFFLSAGHTLLVFYSAYFLSTNAWGIISGGLFYAIFAIYFIVEFIRQKILSRRKVVEMLPVVDKYGKIVGKATREACHSDKKLIHPVVHLHIFNKNMEIYLQKRADHKLVQPGKWDSAVGGHVEFNEPLNESLERESYEELGISGFQPQMIAKYLWESEIERELVFMFITFWDKPVHPDKAEITCGKYWKFSEIEENMGKGLFTPNFEKEFEILKNLQNNEKKEKRITPPILNPDLN
jgi:isopentenyldiphosphate isomerase